PGMEDALSPSSVAARVAERYARLPSYREMLEAQAAAAKAAIDSMVLETAKTPPPFADEPTQPTAEYDPAHSEPEPAPEPYQPQLLRYSVSIDSLPAPRSMPLQARPDSPVGAQRTSASQDFQDPMDEALVEPAQPLPARLVTSPRELVAPRKARPRLAEGPLRDDPHTLASQVSTTPAAHQFAEPDQPMAHSPAGGTHPRTPEVGLESVASPSTETPPAWPSIHLDADSPMRDPKPSSFLHQGPHLHVASLEDRAMAALVDCALTLCAFLLFSLVFAVSSTSFPHGRVALIGAALALFAMWLIYQLLFFSLTDATPGMRYAKIALCTFGDGNPTHSALRGRIAALLLSALPLGLGFLWAVFDEDALGWHDRITQTYQRSYRKS
ncbi:MAG: RDD family protein, partial [Acidobacteriaceae bacterium]